LNKSDTGIGKSFYQEVIEGTDGMLKRRNDNNKDAWIERLNKGGFLRTDAELFPPYSTDGPEEDKDIDTTSYFTRTGKDERVYKLPSELFINDSDSGDHHNELIGFPNYQGPTEEARLMFILKGVAFQDTIAVGDKNHDSGSVENLFKQLAAGTVLQPTGTIPMFRDKELGGIKAPMTEYLGVFNYIAMKLGLMGSGVGSVTYFLRSFINDLASSIPIGICVYDAGFVLRSETFDFAKHFNITEKEIAERGLLKEETHVENFKSWLRGEPNGSWYNSILMKTYGSFFSKVDKKLSWINSLLKANFKDTRDIYLEGTSEPTAADVMLLLQMLRMYGRKIVREAIGEEFQERYPYVVHHFFTILREYPALREYLKDPSRHYRPTYAYLNQAKRMYEYGDILDDNVLETLHWVSERIVVNWLSLCL